MKKNILSQNKLDKTDSAVILPFEFQDRITGQKVKVRVSPYYSILSIDQRDYFFIRETGAFDGTCLNFEPPVTSFEA